jgi:hypothetical protein
MNDIIMKYMLVKIIIKNTYTSKNIYISIIISIYPYPKTIKISPIYI